MINTIKISYHVHREVVSRHHIFLASFHTLARGFTTRLLAIAKMSKWLLVGALMFVKSLILILGQAQKKVHR